MTTFAFIKDRVVRIGGNAHRGWLPGGAVVPLPTPTQQVVLDLEIVDDGAGHFLLVYSSRNSDFCGDTWHESLEEAFDTAELTFGIARSEWTCR